MIDCITSPLLSAQSPLSHAFTTRKGGVSTGLFDSLNAGLEKGDNPDHVMENRRRIADHLGAHPDHLITVRQVHSNTVIVVDTTCSPEERQTGDALVTSTPGLLIGIITADCVPILMADPQAGIIAAAHAGWKGATSGIIANTIETMESLGATRQNIKAGIGPCIWQESYEVDQGFYDHVTGLSNRNDQFFEKSAQENHWQFDLPGFTSHLLQCEGVDQISPSPADTYTNKDQFFSYRRKTHHNESVFGCSLSAIILS